MRGSSRPARLAPARARARPASAAAIALALLGAVIVACGSKRPPPAGEATFTGPPAQQNGFGDGGALLPPGCGAQSDGSYCDCVDTPLFTDPPNLYFILDRSGSMTDQDKWDSVRQAVGNVLRGIGPRASFGAMEFPSPAGGDQCTPGAEVMSLRAGDPPSTNGADGPTTHYLLTVTNQPPEGGTPTAATLTGALPHLQSFAGKTFVILATDGGPNCAEISCDASQCINNIENVDGCPPGGPPNCCAPPNGPVESCLDGTNTVNAVAAIAKAGIPVYVIGIPGSGPYSALLDQMATAGGTAAPTSPKYFKIDTASQDAFLATLKQVAAKIIATCTFKLKAPPPDPNDVNVYLDEVVLPADPQNGWQLDGEDGDTVELLGSACQKVLAGDVLDVRIIEGCPTVKPN